MLDNKGFAISTILYALLLMATLVIFLLIGNFSFERNSTSEFVNNIKNELNGDIDDNTSSLINTVDKDDVLKGTLVDVTGSTITDGDKIKILSSSNDNYVINIDGVIELGTNINLFINTDSNGQEFRIVSTGDGINYYIVPYSNDSLCLDSFGTNEGGVMKVQLLSRTNADNADNKKFRFVETADAGVYYISSVYGECLNILDANISNNTTISSLSCNNNNEQKWKFIKI